MKYALFDLDGTLTPMDTQALFRHYVLERRPWRVVLIVPFLLLTPFKLLGLVSTKTLKRAFLSYLWRLPPDVVARWADDFAQETADHLIFPEVFARLQQARAAGARCVLNTASPDVYAVPLGRALGFQEIFATRLDVSRPYRFFPKFHGPNNKGEAKMPRMAHFLPRERPVPGCQVFTDSAADLPMLRAACLAVLVSPGSRLTAALIPWAETEILEPSMPWAGRRPGFWLWCRLFLGLGSRPRF